MSKKITQTIIIISVLFLSLNCGGIKKTVNNTANNTPKKIIAEQQIIYVPQKKAERKDVFPTSALENKWVDSIYSKMTTREKIGQLFMVSAYSNKDAEHTKAVDKLINEYKVGGLIFFQGGPGRQAILTNHYQSITKTPLFIAIDGEWGLSMRLDSTYRYPWNMTLGAIQDLKLIEKVGQRMGIETKRMGMQFNFAPVLDINTNPKNPIINFRSFGENKTLVTDKALALIKGFQSEGVFSTGKHFPGHGDTSTDSHKTLPVVTSDKERIDMVELYPYKRTFDEGLTSVMVGHLNIPSLEPSGYPTSISHAVVTNLLQKEMGFEGLIFTDGLNMKGVSMFKKDPEIEPQPGEVSLNAFLAGNDILLCPDEPEKGIELIDKAYQENKISEERLAQSVKKILRYKYKAGLNNLKPIETKTLHKDLNSSESDALQYQLYENAITVLKNKNEILPIKNLNQKIAYIKLGDASNTAFIKTLKKYTEITEIEEKNVDSLNLKLKNYDIVIAGFHKQDKAWEKHDFSEKELLLLEQISKKNKVILDAFVKPYSLAAIPSFDDLQAVIQSYQNSDISQIVSSEIIFGAVDAKGKLPVSVGNTFHVGDGLNTRKINRLGFTAPENEGMNPLILRKIDEIAQKAIEGKITPGMQILVAKNGKVIFQKSYGYHTYDKVKHVTDTDLYDVASISKMISTLPNVMKMYDQNKINLDTKLGNMVPFLANSNKKDIDFKSLLSHYAGLQSWIPFYKATLNAEQKPSDKYYRKTVEKDFYIPVCENLFLRNDYLDTIKKIITYSPLLEKKEYKYSDFTFILLKEYLERTTKKKLNVLSYENFFKPMGMNYTLYNPLDKFLKDKITPTEDDNYFRYQIVHGYVHDMAAAMEGGVSGHAGIFSNAMDVAKMMQLFLQKGSYGNEQYFSAKTFDDFNTCYFEKEGVYRGLGFDKRLDKSGSTCNCVSPKSFGHTGFTGNMAWADPETGIVYVFLSNRTFPIQTDNKLSKARIREDIQQIIQDAIIK